MSDQGGNDLGFHRADIPESGVKTIALRKIIPIKNMR